MSKPHRIVKEKDLTFAPVLHGTMRCPRCLSSWDGGPIPEAIREHYSPPYRWSKCIGIELPGVYDGIHHWKCPACDTEFPRWMEKDGKPLKRMFPD